MKNFSSQKHVFKDNFLYLQCRIGYDIMLRMRSTSFRLRNLDNSKVRGMVKNVIVWTDYMLYIYMTKGVSCFSISKHWAVESLLVRND